MRVICNLRRRERLAKFYTDLHWLKIDQRIIFKVLLTVYKCLHNKGPPYLNELLEIKDIKTLTLKIIFFPLTSTGDRAFIFYSSRFWNALPIDIRVKSSLESFKRAVKSLLFTDFHKFINTLNCISNREIYKLR